MTTLDNGENEELDEEDKKSVREAPVHRARTRAQAYVPVLGWLFCAIVAAGIYMNVIADPSAVRERAGSMARQRAGCGEQCRVLEMHERRSVLDYRADYEIAGKGSVQVVCRRAAIVVGAHDCSAH